MRCARLPGVRPPSFQRVRSNFFCDHTASSPKKSEPDHKSHSRKFPFDPNILKKTASDDEGEESPEDRHRKIREFEEYLKSRMEQEQKSRSRLPPVLTMVIYAHEIFKKHISLHTSHFAFSSLSLIPLLEI
jgi:hypothetical protein